jgi:peptide/nickel transport system substrate-binding protein
MSKKLLNLLLVVMMLAVLVPTALAAPPVQEEGQDYVVVADDWLSKLAEKYLGNPLAYPAIVDYTNQKHAEDDSYANITDPDLVEIGWKIYIPSAAEAKAYTEGPAAIGEVCPQRGGTLTVVQAISPRTIDSMIDPGAEGINILSQSMEGLLRFNEKSEVVPALAEAWSISADGLVYNFKLRKGVKFHAGDDFSAKDVIYTFKRLMDPEGIASFRQLYIDHIEKVEAANDYEVDITLKEPWPAFPIFLAANHTFIVNQRVIEEAGDQYGFTVTSGTGAFKFKEWVKDDHLTLVRNENYWQEGLPCVDEVVYRLIADPGVMMVNLETGAVNVLQDPPMELISDFAANPDLRVQQFPDNAIFIIEMNAADPPFDDVRVRQAFSKAIDRQEIADIVFASYAESADDFFPSHFWAHDPSLKVPYDPEGAKALLAEAGYDANNPLKFTFHVYNKPPYTDIGTLIQAQLKEIGVEVEVIALDTATVIDLIHNAGGQDRRTMNAGMVRHIARNVAEEFVANRYATFGKLHWLTLYNEEGGVQNPEAEDLMRQVSSLSDYIEKDRTEAKELYRQLAEIILLEDVPEILTVIQANLDITRTEVQDFPTSVADWVPLYRVWLKQ